MRLSAVRVGLVAVLVLAASAAFPQGQQIIGIPSVIDGDTIEIHGKRIRLFGIDAPEDGQQCSRPDGNRWRCGQHAASAGDLSPANSATSIAMAESSRDAPSQART
jgi:hypothetical protein